MGSSGFRWGSVEVPEGSILCGCGQKPCLSRCLARRFSWRLLVRSSRGKATGKSTESKGTPEAKALLAQAEAKMRGAPDYDAGILLLKQAIQADPHFAEAYERLYSATHSAATAKANQTQAKTGDLIDAAMNDLKKQYATWAAADPKNAILAWAQGSLEEKDWAKGQGVLRPRRRARSVLRAAVPPARADCRLQRRQSEAGRLPEESRGRRSGRSAVLLLLGVRDEVDRSGAIDRAPATGRRQIPRDRARRAGPVLGGLRDVRSREEDRHLRAAAS